MHTITRLVTMLALALVTLTATGGGNESVTSDSDVALSFPHGATITTTISASDVVDNSVSLLWRAALADVETVAPATLEDNGQTVTATVALDLQREFTPVGIAIAYRWVTGSAPFTPIGDAGSFDWHDTRWAWDAVSSGMVTVHTYGDGAADGPAVLTSATTTLAAIEARYGVTLTHPVELWVYPTMADFSGTLQENAREAIAGVAYPEYGVISSILPVGQPAEIERVIPHEITHQVLAQATENPWNRPPLWFDEGLAVYLQTGGTGSYERMLDRVGAEERVFSLNALGYAFPFAPADAALAYAQSWSVVSWLHETYGDDGVAKLIAAFATGGSWDDAIRSALGTDIETIERHWRARFRSRDDAASARLVTEMHHDVPREPTTTPPAPLSQERPQWLLIPASNTEHAFSTRPRSSASWR